MLKARDFPGFLFEAKSGKQPKAKEAGHKNEGAER
jgi:hypothetical protein